jgi:hypothetical protein
MPATAIAVGTMKVAQVTNPKAGGDQVLLELCDHEIPTKEGVWFHLQLTSGLCFATSTFHT